MKTRLATTMVAAVVVAGVAGGLLLPDGGEGPGFWAVADQASEMSTEAALSATPEPTPTTRRPSSTTSTVPPTTTTSAPPSTTAPTATAPAPPAPPPPSPTTTDLSRADEYGCTHANGCLPYGGDGRTSGELQHEWGCEQGYITAGC